MPATNASGLWISKPVTSLDATLRTCNLLVPTLKLWNKN